MSKSDHKKITIATVTTSAPCRLAILAFVAHHLSIGVDEIFVYVDGPEDNNLSIRKFLGHHVEIIFCDAGYWLDVHRIPRPADHRRRQVLNANHALAKTQVDFIAHIDIDEFLFFNSNIDHILRGLPNSCIGLHLLPCEAIYPSVPENYCDAYSGLFKKRIPSGDKRTRILKELHGEFGCLLEQGFQGHHVGKALVRNVQGLTLGLHFPKLDAKPLVYQQNDAAQLLHFCLPRTSGLARQIHEKTLFVAIRARKASQESAMDVCLGGRFTKWG